MRFEENRPCIDTRFSEHGEETVVFLLVEKMCIRDRNDSLDEECTLPRIIGIEGIWGSGKSNVVKMLERELDVYKRQG